MLSKPTEWQFSKKGILSELALDGESAIQAGVKKLQKAGYLTITQEKPNGKFGKAVWVVSDSPQQENRSSENRSSENHANIKNRNTNNRSNKTEEKKSVAAPGIEAGALPSHACFFPPGVNDVREYCETQGYGTIDPERFISYYSSRGWMAGNTAITDWRAAVDTWNRKDVKDQHENCDNKCKLQLGKIGTVV